MINGLIRAGTVSLDVAPHRSLIFSMVAGSSRRSSLVPTRTTEVCGAWWEISGYH